MKVRRKNRGQTMTEYALILAAVAVVAYGLTPSSGYNFLDDAITGLLGKVTSML
jgi:Flp pilus assembly pilin Flp